MDAVEFMQFRYVSQILIKGQDTYIALVMDAVRSWSV